MTKRNPGAKETGELSRRELRKRLALDAMSDPGGLDTSLTMIGEPAGPLGEHLMEGRGRAGEKPPGEKHDRR